MSLEYLCIGHVCQDIKEMGYALGGSAAYSSICAHLLGKKTGIITSFGEDFQFLSSFKNIAVHFKEAETTTLFENVYDKRQRIQFLHRRASTLFKEDIPQEWLKTPLVHIGPIANEVDFEILTAFPTGAVIAATPQGWMRKWDKKTGRISPKILDWRQLANVDILILSDEDIRGQEHLLPEITQSIDLVVLTRGHLAASIYFKEKKMDFPVFPVEVLDPTGAGDTFATGFLVKYMETKNLAQSMAYGHVVASFCIEAQGLKGLEHLNLVEERFMQYCKFF